jgi:hypothetical protein
LQVYERLIFIWQLWKEAFMPADLVAYEQLSRERNGISPKTASYAMKFIPAKAWTH